MSAAQRIVEKTMSADEPEVLRCLAQLLASLGIAGDAPLDRLPLGNGTVAVTITRLAPIRLGGLLVLPRSLVTLGFSATSYALEASFLKSFNSAFQRGGG